MNPARSLGPALAAGEWTAFAAYIAGPVLGPRPVRYSTNSFAVKRLPTKK